MRNVSAEETDLLACRLHNPVSYPFSSSVSHPDVSTSDVPAGPFSLMDKVNKSLLLSSTSSFRSLFHRRSADRIPPGSIISVETYNQLPAPGSDEAALANVGAAAFAGVLMKVKRRHAGVDDAFTVRANVGKPSTGTEVRFDVNSPWIKNVKVLKRDDDKRYVDFPLALLSVEADKPILQASEAILHPERRQILGRRTRGHTYAAAADTGGDGGQEGSAAERRFQKGKEAKVIVDRRSVSMTLSSCRIR